MAKKTKATPEELAQEESIPQVMTEEVSTEITPDPTKHILVDMGGSGIYVLMDIPEDYGQHDRRMVVNGVNVEHVSRGVNGVWQYRAM